MEFILNITRSINCFGLSNVKIDSFPGSMKVDEIKFKDGVKIIFGGNAK